MPKGSEALTNARKEEIIDACAALYETMGFRDITIRDIGARTSFTRTSIYNYFQTKEEIFLALLQREHEAWIADLEELVRRRACMLKLESMNLYDMEGSSRMENLVAFKRTYGRAMEAVARCLETFFPAMTEQEVREFLYAFFPFLFGVYPYAVPTEKQRRAMALAGVEAARCSIRQLVRVFVLKMLRPFQQPPAEA